MKEVGGFDGVVDRRKKQSGTAVTKEEVGVTCNLYLNTQVGSKYERLYHIRLIIREHRFNLHGQQVYKEIK